MARFYASIRGNRSERTCRGTLQSGIFGHIRGWSIGASVEMNDQNGEDKVIVRLTRGSDGGQSFLLFEGTHKDYEDLYLKRKSFSS